MDVNQMAYNHKQIHVKDDEAINVHNMDYLSMDN